MLIRMQYRDHHSRSVNSGFSFTWTLLCLGILLTAGRAGTDGTPEPGTPVVFQVQSYEDTQSSGWAFKSSDTAFVIELNDCRIQWNVVELKGEKKKKELSVRRNCSRSFTEQLPLHRAILKAIFSRFPADDIDTLSWGPFGSPADWSWNIPIAIASSKSEDYQDYRRNYPNSVLTDINGIFVTLANQSSSYQALQNLFQEFGLSIELTSVEKVFASKAGDLSFFGALKDHGIGVGTRVIYDAGSAYFKIHPERRD